MIQRAKVITNPLAMTVNYTLMAIPDGVAGIKATLQLMRKITRDYKKTGFVRELVLEVLRAGRVPQFTENGKKNWVGQIKAIHNFVKYHIQYVKDIRGVETLQTPPQTFRLKHGDCDDKCILAASMLEAIGHPTRFVAVGFQPEIYSHVFLQTRIGANWVTLECTEDWPLGKGPKGIVGAPIIVNN